MMAGDAPGCLSTEQVMKLVYLTTADLAASTVEEFPTVTVAGIATYVFLRAKVIEHKAEIANLLRQLPEPFSQPGGWPLSVAAYARDGRKWTSLEMAVDALFALGIASGQASVMRDLDGKPVGAVILDRIQ